MDRDLDRIIRAAIRHQVEHKSRSNASPMNVRDLELARDRMFTRLALSEPLHDLRIRLRREEGL
jgi:hypothetical protein